MDVFFAGCFSFPTLVFSILLGVIVLYWLSVILGISELDMGINADIDVGDVDGGSTELLSALLTKIKLNRIPLSISITLITLFAWIISYNIYYFFLQYINDTTLFIPTSVGTLIASFVFATLLTSSLAISFQALFPDLFISKSQALSINELINKNVTIRTRLIKPEKLGQAIFKNGGADLILTVKNISQFDMNEGENVTIASYEEPQHLYHITPIKEQDK